MIHKFSKEDIMEKVTMMDSGKLSLSPGETLVIFWDYDKYDLDDASHIYKGLSDIFPQNQIILMPKETKLGVIKNESYSAL